MPGVVITGMNGVVYQGFPPQTVGAWSQPILGSPPYYYYVIGGNQYNISPESVSGFPYWEGVQTVPFRPIRPISW
ncbi:hypothetical protein JOC85_003718 [Bacillus mesophilus]|uniref:Uncharacterized protein n=1 Tax=Bacillus mesophilus TaxID=1808955 RepID=A0A6M0QAX5_9BACI|nr:hypothetical protein [Bacillus mesophilus]MBM7662907.1 hypothetical protein [Bacillus mesophilus]NEY73496.1 hypothetical protein [Bacillus mesophilus]